jgi:putative oxidoreductase
VRTVRPDGGAKRAPSVGAAKHRLETAVTSLYANTGKTSVYANVERWRPQALSVLRIVVALLFLQHGLSKLIGFPEAGPPLNGLLVVAAILETIGSLLLILGVYARIAAFVLSGEMAVAYFMAHAPHGFYPMVNHGEEAILFCFVFLYIAFAGGGAWSVDRLALRQD